MDGGRNVVMPNRISAFQSCAEPLILVEAEDGALKLFALYQKQGVEGLRKVAMKFDKSFLRCEFSPFILQLHGKNENEAEEATRLGIIEKLTETMSRVDGALSSLNPGHPLDNVKAVLLELATVVLWVNHMRAWRQVPVTSKEARVAA